MKVIAGKYKNLIIPTLKNANYKPSTSRFKEALFSILTSGEFALESRLIGAKVLDLYSGTGALSFEALSRGASHACMIDSNYEHLKLSREFATKIGELSNCKFLRLDAVNLPISYGIRYDIVFIDPPYYSDMAYKSLLSLIRQNWLSDRAIIAVELSKKEDIAAINSLKQIKCNIYGNNKLLLFRYEKS